MVVWESFNLWPQYNQQNFVPTEVLHEMITGIPNTILICVNGHEDIEQVLDICVLGCDPSRLVKARLVGINID